MPFVKNGKLYQLAANKRTYYKYIYTAQEQIAVEVNLNGEDVYEDWTQPVLSANGTMGGDKFAVTESSVHSGDYAYKAFDGSNSTQFTNNGNTGYLTFYNPIPLKVYKLHIVNGLNSSYVRPISSGVVSGSDDNTNWTPLKEFTNTVTTVLGEWDIDLSQNKKGYLYYKIDFVGDGAFARITELTITAKKLTKIGGTIEDADYYVERLVSYSPIVRGERYYFKQNLKQRDTGTYTFTLNKEYTAKMLFVGNGGGGCSSQKDSQWHYSGGGSGACFEGLVKLPAGTYTLTIGELGYGNNRDNVHYHSSTVVSTDSYLTNSAGQELIRVGAGGNGYTSVGGVSGAAGVLKLGTLNVLETKKAVNGNTQVGKTAATNYSLSAYDGTASGYGAGTGAERYEGNVYGIAGIFDLALVSTAADYDFFEDIGTKFY